MKLELDEQTRLKPSHGRLIDSLITKHTHMSRNEFAESIDMHPAQLSKYLSGTLPITQKALNKILAGIQEETETTTISWVSTWATTITLHQSTRGKDVPSAGCTNTEEK